MKASPTTADRTDRSLIQAVDRAVRLLKAVAAGPHPATALELAQTCGLNRSTAWRLLTTLEHHGLVERDPVTQRYRVGYGVMSIADGASHASLVRAARPFLDELAAETGETVTLCVVSPTGLVTVDQVNSAQFVSVQWIGSAVPIHCNSAGKVWLASLPEDEREAFLSRPLERYTDRTVTDPDELRRELERIRSTGTATSAGEFEPGLHGASAAIHDVHGRAVAFVNVSGPAYRMPAERLEQFGRLTLQTTKRITERLGG